MTELVGVSETLLLTLYARALESRLIDGIISDPVAEELYRRVDVDMSRFTTMWATQVATAVRTEVMDEATSIFLDAHGPDATVIELGAGLTTRPFRLGEERAHWLALDLPQVAVLHERLLGSSDRRRVVATDVLDVAWISTVGDVDPARTLFIAEGLLMYLEPEQVRWLVTHIAARYPGATMVFDSLGPAMSRITRLHPAVRKTDVIFRWGVADLRSLENWSGTITFDREWRYLERHARRWKWIRLTRYLPVLRSELKAGQLIFRPPQRRVGTTR